MCPQCLSTNLSCIPVDFGVDAGTGYEDAGERFECRACGATGDAAEVTLRDRTAPEAAWGSSELANVRKPVRSVTVHIFKITQEVA